MKNIHPLPEFAGDDDDGSEIGFDLGALHASLVTSEARYGPRLHALLKLCAADVKAAVAGARQLTPENIEGVIHYVLFLSEDAETRAHMLATGRMRPE